MSTEAVTQTNAEDWSAWWDALKREPGMEPMFAERERRFIERTHHGSHTLVELHEAALRDLAAHGQSRCTGSTLTGRTKSNAMQRK